MIERYAPFDSSNSSAEFLLHHLPVELQGWAREGYTYGYIRLDDLRDPLQLRDTKEQFLTAAHERGHEAIAIGLQWDVETVSVEPNQAQGILGFTEVIPPADRPVEELFIDKMAICLGGLLAEQRVGHADHRGCSSDLAQFSFLNQQMEQISPSARVEIASQARQRAIGAMSGLNETKLRRQAWDLLDRKVIAA